MKLGKGLLAGVLCAFATTATITATAETAQTSKQTTTTTTTERTTFSGPVVRYEPGRTIVIRQNGRETTYSLGSDLVVPSSVAVGRTVTLYTNGEPGSFVVTRITQGDVTTQEAAELMPQEPAPGTTVSETQTTKTYTKAERGEEGLVTVTGTVKTYEPTKTVTILQPDGTEVTYLLESSSVLPKDLEIGKTVTVKTTTTTTGSPTVKKITYTKVTKTTK